MYGSENILYISGVIAQKWKKEIEERKIQNN